jgi:hypothetical protein
MNELLWEPIDSKKKVGNHYDGYSAEKARVLGGHLIRISFGNQFTVTFVPDSNYIRQ